MKKWVIILSIIILATITYTSFSAESEYYVKSVPIYKIYHHNKGFIVLYQKQDLKPHRIFLPYKWFQVPDKSSADWKAEVIYGRNTEYPYMNIYWNKTGFSHVRIFLRENKGDPSYGLLQNPNIYDNSFDSDVPDFVF